MFVFMVSTDIEGVVSIFNWSDKNRTKFSNGFHKPSPKWKRCRTWGPGEISKTWSSFHPLRHHLWCIFVHVGGGLSTTNWVDIALLWCQRRAQISHVEAVEGSSPPRSFFGKGTSDPYVKIRCGAHVLKQLGFCSRKKKSSKKWLPSGKFTSLWKLTSL